MPMPPIVILPIGKTVVKKSGKPFKSGKKSAIIKGVIERTVPTAPKSGIREVVAKPFYFFEDEGDNYFVSCAVCIEKP